MSSTIKMPAELATESVNIMADAAALATKVAEDQARLDSRAPLVADVLIENGIVDELDKQAAVEMLTDPAKLQDMVSKLAKHAAAPRSMGAPVTSGEIVSDPQFPAEKESDAVFRNILFRD